MSDRAAYAVAAGLVLLAASVWFGRPRYELAAFGGQVFVSDVRSGATWELSALGTKQLSGGPGDAER